MDLDSLRAYCLSFPHTTENIQWGDNLVFKVAGKLLAIVSLDAVPPTLAFKCSPEGFTELLEIEGIRPAPYMARAQWVMLESLDVLPAAELKERLKTAYEMVWQKIPRKTREQLQGKKAKKAK